jgi:hypothetical protein
MNLPRISDRERHLIKTMERIQATQREPGETESEFARRLQSVAYFAMLHWQLRYQRSCNKKSRAAKSGGV